MAVKISTERLTRIEDEAVVAGFFYDVRPLKGLAGEIDWLFNGEVSRLIMDGKISGQAGDSLLLVPNNRLKAGKALILGMGNRSDFDPAGLRNMTKILLQKLIALDVRRFAVEVFGAGYKVFDYPAALKIMHSELKRVRDMEISFFVDKNIEKEIGMKLKGILDS